MVRSLTLASAVLAASLTASALAAQSNAPAAPKPAATSTMSHAPTAHAKTDSGTTAAAMSQPKPASARHAVWTTDQIKEAQMGLAKAGLYKGKTTGVFNGDTRKALRAYQKQNKLPVTGRLSDDVLAKLKTA